MTPPTAVRAEQQADALVAEIGRKLAEQQREVLDAADREADAIRQRARIKARRQMRRAIEQMRASEGQRTVQVRAELETLSRRQASARSLAALAAAWPQLAAAIERRWKDAAARMQWLGAQLALARSRLPGTAWLLRHPGDWSEAETSALRELLQAHGVADATLRPDVDLCVGIVIEAGGVRLDSTPAALLIDRARVEAALLARLESTAAHEGFQ